MMGPRGEDVSRFSSPRVEKRKHATKINLYFELPFRNPLPRLHVISSILLRSRNFLYIYFE